MRPLFGMTLIEPTERQTQTPSGIVLPDSVDNSQIQQGKIVAIGSGSLALNGDPIPMEVGVGQVVIFRKFAGIEVSHNNKKHYLVEQKEILAEL